MRWELGKKNQQRTQVERQQKRDGCHKVCIINSEVISLRGSAVTGLLPCADPERLSRYGWH